MAGIVHIVGAGLSGLAAGVCLVRAGRRVAVHEAAGQAGGRCRSFFDATLDRRIDNGNHLLLSGNGATHAYLDATGASGALTGPNRAAFDFADVTTGSRWTVRPGPGRVPWWVLAPGRRVPGSRLSEYLRAVRLRRPPHDATVARCLGGPGPLYARFWEPLAVAALNTSADEGAASLLWPVVRETFGRGEAHCRPRIARDGLSEALVDPAVRTLEAAGAAVRMNRRLRGLAFDGDRVGGLDFGDGESVVVGPADAVVLAVPPAAAAALVPGLTTPRTSRAIVNGHFRLPQSGKEVSFLGIVGGLVQWLFVRGDIVSTTISAADPLLDVPNDVLAGRMWREVALVLGLGPAPLPVHRILTEKRATFAQTPEEIARRPGTRTAWSNLFLAGDWTDTGLPATIEGSVRSGRSAAEAVFADAANT